MDSAFIKKLLVLYAEDADLDITVLKKAVKNSDSELLNKTVHKLKSSSELLGLKEVVKLSVFLEKETENKKDIILFEKYVPELIDLLEDAIKEISEFLKA